MKFKKRELFVILIATAAILLSGCEVLPADYLPDDQEDTVEDSSEDNVNDSSSSDGNEENFLYADDNIVPENWEVRYSEPVTISADDLSGKWYLFNIYTIDEITPDDMEFLLFSFENDSKKLYLRPLETEYEGASNFRAWVYIPNSYIENNNLLFDVVRPDENQVRNFERLNFRISGFTQQYDGNEYYWMTIPYEGNPAAAEFRKIVRTWEDVELQEQSISFGLEFDTVLDTGDVSFDGVYTCAPRNGGGTSSNWNHPEFYVSSKKTDSAYEVTMKHLYHLSETAENEIDNFAAINIGILKPMYNDLRIYRSREESAGSIADTIDHGNKEMEVLTFLTLKYEISDDENFGDGEVKSITLSSIDEYSLGEYAGNMPYIEELMTDIQSFDPDADGTREIMLNRKYGIGFRVEESYFGSSDTISFEDIENFNDASEEMSRRYKYNGNSYSDGDTVICRTSSDKYVRIELTQTRPITSEEFNEVDSGNNLTNPIDDVLSE